ncbi:GrpB family protein [Brevibacterium atlanticum]|uniref:GrpB family protein n=1 Tax=Brevibacterium atlanticum TaxID=2697563 RepID=UPI001AA1C1CB|nr:GrpB family protein [Brevibacterium atlanticum]
MTHPPADGSPDQGPGREAPPAGGESVDPMFAEVADIVTFIDAPEPDLWIRPSTPPVTIEIVDHDPAWTDHYADLADQVRDSLAPQGSFVGIDHVGSTSVPGLKAKPILDLALVVIDPRDEDDYVPALNSIGLDLTVREPAWYQHRLLKRLDPEPGQLHCNLHVFGPRCAEVARMRLFRDHLRIHPDDRERYQAVKLASAAQSNAAGETVTDYNARKQSVLREIYHHVFASRGWV